MSGSTARSYLIDDYLGNAYRQRRPELAFRARTKEEWLTWRSLFQAKLIELMGGFPTKRCPLQPELMRRDDCGDYFREKIVFESEPGVSVPAYVLVPKGAKPPLPGLLCLHGHGNGKDDVVGIAPDPKRRDYIRALNYDYAVQFVRRGYVTITMDARGFGERRTGYEFEGRDGCNVVFLKCLLLGLNPLTLNVWDAMRCVDYLGTRPEVDSERIGCVGLSYGGTLTLYTAALDQRIKVATISCYLNTFKAYALDLNNTC